MTSQIGRGDVVETTFGMRGLVLSVRGDDVLVKLDPPNELQIALRRDQLRVLRQEHVDIARPLPQRPDQPLDSTLVGADTLALRHDIEALRFGLVPSRSLPRTTIGYADTRRWALSRLPHENDGKPTFSQVRGAFGTGKTHVLSVVRHAAQEMNYLTAHVEVDGSRVTLGDPGQLLGAIWGSLTDGKAKSSTPLFDIYERAVGNGHHTITIAPVGIDRVQRAYDVVRALLRHDPSGTCRQTVEAIVASDPTYNASRANRVLRDVPTSGYPLQISPMIGIKVAERPFDFIESLIGHTIVAERAGYAGIALTIDEFEVERSFSRRWPRVESLLNVLIQYFNGQLPHRDAPIGIFVATVGESEDGSDAALDRVVDAVGGDVHDVEPLSQSDIAKLSSNIIELYALAYGTSGDDPVAMANEIRHGFRSSDYAESGFTRALIKAVVARLDARHKPVRSS